MVIIETHHFAKQIEKCDGFSAVQGLIDELRFYPEKGDLIPHSNGLRKIRMAASGRGKRGGARAIYLYLPNAARIYLLHLYLKKDESNLNQEILALLRQSVANIKKSYETEQNR